MRATFSRILGITGLLLIMASNHGAQATVFTTDCAQADVQAAVNSAANGDIVQVQPGACTWSGPVTIVNKSITLQGAGSGCNSVLTPMGHPPSSCTGVSTSITSTTDIFDVTDDTQGFRITGFQFNKDTYDGSHTITINKDNAYLSAKNATPWRIDDNYFNGTGGHISITGARNFGVADHNIYYVPGGAQIFVFWGTGTNEELGTSDLAILAGQDAHTDPISLGSDNAFYIEDSEFFTNVWQGSQNVTDGTAGQRVVFRYNVERGSMVENHGACSGPARGTYTWEIYENDIYPQDWDGTTGYQWAGIRLRGGTGVIFNNRFYGTWDPGAGEIYFDSQRASNYIAPDCAAPVNTYCSGSAIIDTNAVAGQTGPLCLDQIGGGSGEIGAQKLNPAYVWNNTDQPAGNVVNPRIDTTDEGTTPIFANEDFYNTSLPGYVPYPYPYPYPNYAISGAVSGACGAANGTTVSAKPTANLCSAGTASAVAGTGPYTWSCAGSGGGATAMCSATLATGPTPVNGICGPMNGLAVNVKPAAGLCSAGTASAVAGAGPFTWTCAGSNGGTTAACSATLITSAPVNGACGSSNGATVSAKPTANLCTVGTASAVTGTGPYTWSCAGSNGGTSTACSAYAASTTGAVDGVCGPIDTTTVAEKPTTDLCTVGKASKVTGKGPYLWGCAGINGGATAWCWVSKD